MIARVPCRGVSTRWMSRLTAFGEHLRDPGPLRNDMSHGHLILEMCRSLHATRRMFDFGGFALRTRRWTSRWHLLADGR